MLSLVLCDTTWYNITILLYLFIRLYGFNSSFKFSYDITLFYWVLRWLLPYLFSRQSYSIHLYFYWTIFFKFRLRNTIIQYNITNITKIVLFAINTIISMLNVNNCLQNISPIWSSLYTQMFDLAVRNNAAIFCPFPELVLSNWMIEWRFVKVSSQVLYILSSYQWQ